MKGQSILSMLSVWVIIIQNLFVIRSEASVVYWRIIITVKEISKLFRVITTCPV